MNPPINILRYIESAMLLIYLLLMYIFLLVMFKLFSLVKAENKYNKECEEQKASLINLNTVSHWHYHASVLKDVFLHMGEEDLAHYRKTNPRLTVVGNFVDLRARPTYLTENGIKAGASIACYGLSLGEPCAEITNVFKITEKQAKELRLDKVGANDKIVIAGDINITESSILPLVFDNCEIMKVVKREEDVSK